MLPSFVGVVAHRDALARTTVDCVMAVAP